MVVSKAVAFLLTRRLRVWGFGGEPEADMGLSDSGGGGGGEEEEADLEMVGSSSALAHRGLRWLAACRFPRRFDVNRGGQAGVNRVKGGEQEIGETNNNAMLNMVKMVYQGKPASFRPAPEASSA